MKHGRIDMATNDDAMLELNVQYGRGKSHVPRVVNGASSWLE
jgi:hypothetical protein